MSFFCITDKQHDVTMGKFASVETALMDAITKARVAGERSVHVFFEGYTALVKSGNGQTELFSIQAIPTGGKPGPKPRVKAEQTKPLVPKSVIKFAGKPPADGWYNARAGGELLMDCATMTDALKMARDKDYVLVTADADGNVLTAQSLGNYRQRAEQLLASSSKGASLDLSKFAKEEAGLLLQGVPADAVAGFILLADKASKGVGKNPAAPAHLKPIWKRRVG